MQDPFPPHAVKAPTKSEYFDIQVLRAVAALGVVCDHAAIVTSTARAKPLLLESVAMFLGFFGVYIFFVISGFIMWNSTRGMDNSGRNAFKFLVKRLARIAPLYVLFTALKYVTSLKTSTPLGALFSVLFIPYFNADGEIRPVLGQGWTLNYEMFFYVVFGLSLILPRLWSLIFTAAVLVAAVLCGLWLGHGFAYLAAWQVYTDPILLLFLGGVLLATSSIAVGQRIAVWAQWIYPVLYALAIAVFVVQVLCGLTGDIFQIVMGLLAIAVVGASTLTPIRLHSRAKRVLHFLGSASYSIYLSHTFVIQVLKKAGLNALGASSYIVLCLISAIALGSITHLYLEKPITAVLWRWVRRRK